jgi:hypothetical protein
MLNEHTTYKNCPVILANSIELRGMAPKNEREVTTLSKIKENDEIKELIPKLNEDKKGKQFDMKALILILGYLTRNENLNEDAQAALNEILAKAPYYCELMIQVAMMLAVENKAGRSPKKITARNILTVLDFSQNIS